jgi:hypothetical protein
MIVVGLHNTGINSSAAIVIDGKLKFGYLEERISRRKYDKFFPHKALEKILLLSNITYEGFESNFDGKLNKKLKINWLKERIALIHLLNELKEFLNPDIYTKYDGTIGIAYFAAHFLHKGEVINIRNWTSAKSRLNDNKEKYKENISCNSIDLIISNIKGLA